MRTSLTVTPSVLVNLKLTVSREPNLSTRTSDTSISLNTTLLVAEPCTSVCITTLVLFNLRLLMEMSCTTGAAWFALNKWTAAPCISPLSWNTPSMLVLAQNTAKPWTKSPRNVVLVTVELLPSCSLIAASIGKPDASGSAELSDITVVSDILRPPAPLVLIADFCTPLKWLLSILKSNVTNAGGVSWVWKIRIPSASEWLMSPSISSVYILVNLLLLITPLEGFVLVTSFTPDVLLVTYIPPAKPASAVTLSSS